MTPQNDKPNFFDRSTIIALAIVMAFWVGWTKFMEIKYPTATNTTSVASGSSGTANTTVNSAAPTSDPAVMGSKSAGALAGDTAAQPNSAPNAGLSAGATVGVVQDKDVETFETVSNERWSFQISSRGMGLKDIDLKLFETRDHLPIVLGKVGAEYPFTTRLLDSAQPLNFTIEKRDDKTFVGHAVSGNMTIEKTMTLHPEDYTIATTLQVNHATAGFKGFETIVSDAVPETVKGSFLSRSYETQDIFALGENENKRETITREKGVSFLQSNVEVMALSTHYFTMAVVDHSSTIPSFEARMPANAANVAGTLRYQPANINDQMNFSYVAYAGPKQYTLLESIDPRLAKVIDYGFFALLAKPLLQLMRFLFSMVGNWGVSIILMTILVRLVLLPFNVFSTKSMKAMQKIQPEMNRIKERYKDKPAEQKIQMNQEIMELMKRNKANPVGGCLPMLLQLPVFFALYRVLGQSVELYRAPFMLWIQDLSAKDPLYILPVLMGISMFGQQKLTPTAMDPQQAKIMMWMPVLFSFFMISLPSGLTLYIFVSTLFAIIQQYVLMRDKPAASSVKTAKA